MPARLVPLVNGEYYHVFNRGNNKRPIFLDLRDFNRALRTLEYYSFLTGKLKFSKYITLPKEEKTKAFTSLKDPKNKLVEIISFVFMPNHFHLLLKQNKKNGISNFLRHFQNSFTKYFNTKHKGIGPILQGPFKAVRVEDDKQLLHLTRYIHLNPYTSFLIRDLEKLDTFIWSSLPEYLGKSTNPICSKELILSQFKTPNDYLNFIYDVAIYQRELEEIKHLLLET